MVWPTLGSRTAKEQNIHSFVTGEPRDFTFGTLIYHSKSHLPMKIFPERGMVRVR